jgi:hypothetical protein
MFARGTAERSSPRRLTDLRTQVRDDLLDDRRLQSRGDERGYRRVAAPERQLLAGSVIPWPLKEPDVRCAGPRQSKSAVSEGRELTVTAIT